MRKLNVLVLILFVHSLTGLAQMKWNPAYQSYINQYKDLAIEEMLKYNIPASITLAQGVFESSAGRSYLTVSGNNHFGIKCHDWIGASVYTTDDAVNECFRAYDNALQSYEDHSKFLKNNVRYSRLFSLDRTDYRGWAYGLKACGYATNPQYAPKLIGIIELYKLYQYDTANSYDKFMAKHSTEGSRSGTGMILHPIYVYNNNYYIKARQGDTFKSIGKEIDISYRKIAKYNERNKHDLLQEGEIIYLKKKRSKADKSYKRRPHIVKPGESMYSIAQFYGMRLKNLYKKNDLTPDYQIRVGDTLRVY
ncbi:MAG: glucosaminidase domain-containing protein [Prevotella sp.]|jgi:LysM repeat protein|nr:glucosaminidase domain-containing protein [Prevotella sp.]